MNELIGDQPLHLALVHIPLALALFMPFFIVAAVVAIQRKWVGSRLWIAIVVLQAFLLVIVLVVKETGEDEEHLVEEVVAEKYIEEHEERADLFSLFVTITAVVSAVGIAGGRVGTIARLLTLLLALTCLVLAARVGQSKLVHEIQYILKNSRARDCAGCFIDKARWGASVRYPQRLARPGTADIE